MRSLCVALQPKVRLGRTDAGHAERDRAGLPQGPCRLLDLRALVVGEAVEVGLDPADQRADALDLLLGRGCLGAGPVVQIGCRREAFAVPQQRVEVGPQLGKVGGVGAEVVAADAAEPERAAVPADLDVAGLDADAVGDRDLPDPQAWGVSS